MKSFGFIKTIFSYEKCSVKIIFTRFSLKRQDDNFLILFKRYLLFCFSLGIRKMWVILQHLESITVSENDILVYGKSHKECYLSLKVAQKEAKLDGLQLK